MEYKSGIAIKAKMSDIEVVVISLTTEYMSIESEISLFKQINQDEIPNLIERSHFNKKMKKIVFIFRICWKQISQRVFKI